MVDRVALLRDVSGLVRMPATKGAQYKKALEKAISILLAELPLDAARSLRPDAKKELSTALDQLMTISDLKKISKLWEPKRSVSSGFTQTEIFEALDDLLFERREPYLRPTVSLQQARALPQSDSRRMADDIQRLMPKPELKALLKKWDKNFSPPASYTVPQFRQRLLGLLSGKIEPEAKPAPKPRR